jgi:hypothetical protein
LKYLILYYKLKYMVDSLLYTSFESSNIALQKQNKQSAIDILLYC